MVMIYNLELLEEEQLVSGGKTLKKDIIYLKEIENLSL
jgi:hypothetical protein